VDSEEQTWNINVAKIEEKITNKTKAIMPVHIYGHPVDVDAIIGIAKKHHLHIIEDFAEAIGSEYKGKRCGGFGDISCVSFYANKAVTTGEGGMCLTDDDSLAKKLRSLRNLAFTPEKRFVHHELGFNYRMTNIQAAIGLAQTERLDEHVRKKIRNGETYSGLLRPLEKSGAVSLPVEKEWARNTYWMYGIVLNNRLNLTAEQAMSKMAERGIQTRPFFCPMHKQPAFERYPWFKRECLPVSEMIYQYGFYLPSGLTLTEEQIHKTVKSLEGIVSHGV
jgi:perosamine synthetase